MKLISWNVNGFRACLGKGFGDFFAAEDADFFCLQETKMQPGQADFNPEGYHSYWFSADGGSYVAYRVEGGVAITTGDPVGPAGDLERTVDEFIAFCHDHSWTPCLYSTTEATKRATDRLGWPSLQVAEETVLREMLYT